MENGLKLQALTWPTNTFNSGDNRGCGRSSGANSCDSAFFPSNGSTYSRVCGRIIAYQRGNPDALGALFLLNNVGLGLEDPYVDGLSLRWRYTRATILSC